MTVQHTRGALRALNIIFIVGAFFLIHDTRVAQLTMGAGFMVLAQIEGGLLLWEMGARAGTPPFKRWFFWGVGGESGLTTIVIMILWVLLGVNLVL